MNYPPKIEDSLTAMPIGDNFPVTAEMTQAMAEAFTQPECAPAQLSPEESEVAARLEPILGREAAVDVAVGFGMTEEAFGRLYLKHFGERDSQQ